MIDLIEKLTAIKKRNYFLEPDWEARGLLPSPEKVIRKMCAILILYLNELLKLVEEGKVITSYDISQLILRMEEGDYIQLDTEEREWCSDLFLEIAEEIGFIPLEIIEVINSNRF